MNADRHEVETLFINEWAACGAFELVVSVIIAEEMGRQRLDLLDINHALKTGYVRKSDMLESRGLWNVVGSTVDEELIELQVAVVSSNCEVELLRVMKVRRRRK